MSIVLQFLIFWLEKYKNVQAELMSIDSDDRFIYFYIGVAIVTLLFFGVIIASNIGRSCRGIFSRIIGLLIPIIILDTSLVFYDHFLLNEINSEFTLTVTRVGLALISLAIVGNYIAKKFFDLGWLTSLFVLVLSYGISLGSVNLSKYAIESFLISTQNVEKHLDEIN